MGKSTGKSILSVVGFAFGFINPGAFGVTAALTGGIYGASLASTIWGATHKQSTSTDYKFNAAQNTIDSDAMIPIIYGTRKWAGGLLTWQATYNDAENQRKDVILCEGEATEISGVTANCMMIAESPAFYISNIAYSDATVRIYKTDSPTDDDKLLVLYANGVTTNINLQSSGDIEDDNSNEHCCNLQKLLQYIEKLGCGWRITRNAGIDGEPEDVRDVALQNCYNNPIGVSVAGIDDCSYEAHLGSPTQSPPDNYTTVGSYKNCAYVRVKLKVGDDLAGSSPNISAIVSGRKVYDPRTSTTAYSENPAMCLRDYILNKRFGMGRWITSDMLDEDSFAECADYCDASVTYTDAYGITVTEQRYRLNIIMNQRRKHIENIQEILAVFGGFLVFSGDKLSLRIEKQDSISYSFNESNIKEKSVKFDASDLSSTPNRYSITYYDPAQNWSGIKVLVEDTADQYQRGQVISKEVTLNGCTSQGQSLRLGRLYKAVNRLSGISVTWITGTMAMHLQPGDIVSFSYGVLSGMPLRILEISENKGEWTIKGQQYNVSVYDDRLGAQISQGDYVSIPNALTSALPNVPSLTLEEYGWQSKDGTHVSTIECNWSSITYQFFRYYVLSMSTDGSNWSTIANTLSNSYTITNVESKKYYIKVQVQNSVGRLSSGVTQEITVTGKDDPPDDVAGFSAVQTGDYIKFTWDSIDAPDIRYYEIRMGSSWNNSVAVTQVNAISYTMDAPENGTLNFWIKAVDNFGNYSTNATEKSINIFGLTEKNIITSATVDLTQAELTNIYVNPWDYYEIQTSDSRTYFADMFTTGNTFLSSKLVLPVIDLGSNIIEEDYYYVDPWGNTKIKTVETIGSGTYFADIFNSTTTLVDALYVAETFLSVVLDYNTTDTNSIDIKYQVSIDGNSWSNEISYLTKQFFGRYVRIILYPKTTEDLIHLKSVSYSIDVSDVEDIIENKSISAVKTYVKYNKKFFATPTSVALYVSDVNGNSAIHRKTEVTNAGFYLEILDSGGNLIAGKLDKAVIRGY